MYLQISPPATKSFTAPLSFFLPFTLPPLLPSFPVFFLFLCVHFPYILSSLLLHVDPFNVARRSGEALRAPSVGPGAEPWPKTNFEAFRRPLPPKPHQVTSNVVFLLCEKINVIFLDFLDPPRTAGSVVTPLSTACRWTSWSTTPALIIDLSTGCTTETALLIGDRAFPVAAAKT